MKKRFLEHVAASTSAPKYEEVCFYNEEQRPIADSSAGWTGASTTVGPGLQTQSSEAFQRAFVASTNVNLACRGTNGVSEYQSTVAKPRFKQC